MPPEQEEEYEIGLCENCVQSTNHLKGICQKCKPKVQEEFWQEEIEALPELTEDIPDEKFRVGVNYKLIKTK